MREAAQLQLNKFPNPLKDRIYLKETFYFMFSYKLFMKAPKQSGSPPRSGLKNHNMTSLGSNGNLQLDSCSHQNSFSNFAFVEGILVQGLNLKTRHSAMLDLLQARLNV